MAGEALQHAEEALALGRAQGGEEVGLGLGGGPLGVLQPPVAGVGEADQVAPAVGSVAGADDEAILLKSVEKPDEVAGVDPQSDAELLGPTRRMTRRT